MERYGPDGVVPQVLPRVLNIADIGGVVDWTKETVLVLVCSTTGDGVVPNDARDMYEALSNENENISGANANLVPGNENLQFAVLALGDRSYPHFCRAGRLFEEALTAVLKHGPMVDRVDVDQEDWDEIDGWAAAVGDALQSSLSTAEESDDLDDYLVESILSGSTATAANEPKITREKPLMARVSKSTLLTRMTGAPDDKETIHVELDVSGTGLRYSPGDAIGVVPSNCPDDVEQLLIALATDGAETVLVPASAGKPPGTKCSLKEALLNYCDLRSAKPELVALLGDRCTDGSEKTRATELLGGEGGKKSKTLTDYLAERHVVDVLQDFPSSFVDPTALVDLLRPLTARYYSISSSQEKNAGTVSATVAVLRYESLGKGRKGVATCHLRDRVCVGDSVPIFVSRNNDFRPPKNLSTPIVMIGPGTGIAPFRAFMQERTSQLANDADPKMGENILFFGCRYSDRDFLYREEFRGYESKGHLELFTAFSRETGRKVYVQHRIGEQGLRLWRLMENGAHFYVCGDATKMARDVGTALLELISKHGGLDGDSAQKYLTDMERAHRYQRDVWAS
eukprot:Plantae.Rhodophyta-Rhodochaete_pulchella.ctg2125.p1 GENE.Plantae.Rhodophyta-Rhodochaete_pulchella.ctg2125~~Plantae.Rhodophyta-Rhodochaete_pulchella.ctg2125.p1  ORF type:complete len:570 (+),score=92.54 Plantae.Rhodophyta-Rhodochaete_pulchella.ctg2125:211-1920(+)